MSDLSKIALNLRRWRIGIATHDVENPTHSPAYGIGVNSFDLERLGFDEGEELWSGVTIHSDGKTTGNFRVICGADHDNEREAEVEEAREVTRAVGVPA